MVEIAAHCSPEFLGCRGEVCTDGFLCDIRQTGAGRAVSGPGHITAIQYSAREPPLLAAGCYDGQE